MKRVAWIYASVILTARGLLAGTPASSPTCGGCHPKETARYSATAMGASLTAPAPLPAGRIKHELSNSVITTQQRNGQMMHAVSERGLSAEYSVRYQIGGGLMGRSYMVQIGDYLFESPASWFNSYGWDLSPGYAQKQIIDFDRIIEEPCLFCHAGNAQFADPDGRRLRNANLTSITCERCHGSAEAHVRNPTVKNIVNPAKLPRAARDSVCEQCHLEGATRILSNGKSWSDFHSGEAAETTFATYLLRGGNNSETFAVSQVEQLAESKCARATNGKLWCASCHDPHGEVVDRAREIRTICTGCHATLSRQAHPTGLRECTGCHMPRRPTTDIVHAALTDHRILRYPSEAPRAESEPAKLVAWREPALESRDRDFALAEVVIGFSKNLPPIGSDGIERLKRLPARQQQNDPAVLSDLEGVSLQQGDVQNALQAGHRVIELQSQSAKAAMNLGIVLKKSGDLNEAERQLKRAIDLDPSLKQAYAELAALYASQQKSSEARETINRFLKWNPQDIVFRLRVASALSSR